MLKDMFSQVDLLQKGLDAAWLRNEVITHNIANVETPQFKRSYVEFESLLKAKIENKDYRHTELKTTREKHIPSVSGISTDPMSDIEPIVKKDESTSIRMDGNNVDIEYEMNELAKNVIWYQYMIQKVTKDLGRLKTVINDSK
ncbi:MAG: flagellar basal body rod protein FlgB [Clostridiaceae bacterium]|jgi:flagellar basal-body rod protein FlgB|nr:flagellar basal body rod protein FlgB [Clostridiaceae bacterium]